MLNWVRFNILEILFFHGGTVRGIDVAANLTFCELHRHPGVLLGLVRRLQVDQVVNVRLHGAVGGGGVDAQV